MIGFAVAKHWHNFIGYIPPDEIGKSLGWVLVNYDRLQRDERLVDGRGVTVFKMKANNEGSLEIVEQSLVDE